MTVHLSIYIIISQNIRYLLWNRGFCRSLNNTYPIFLTPCIRCTNHLCDSCDLTDVNPHLSRHCSERFKMLIYCDVIDTRADRQQVWRHNDLLFRRGCYGRFLSTTLWWTVHVFGTELIRSLAIWLAESRDYHLYIYKHGPAATDSYCDVTMAHCSHGYLWTHDIEVGASWRDCDNPQLFGTWLHHFAYRGRMIHYGTLGDQTIYTRFGLICLFILLIIFGLPCFNTGHR